MTLTELTRSLYAAQVEFAAHEEASAKLRAELARKVTSIKEAIGLQSAGLDEAKIVTAETVLFIDGLYSDGGADRASCVDDAIKQFATAAALGPYKDLWRNYFGTKRYDGWYGQRSDHPYGYGPKHGSIIFSVGVKNGLRKAQADLTADEVEACIYYLSNLERIQETRIAARQAAE